METNENLQNKKLETKQVKLNEKSNQSSKKLAFSSAMFKNSFIIKGFSFFHFDFESCYTLEHDILTFSFAFGKWLANKIQLPSSINLLTAKKKSYVCCLFLKKKNESEKLRITLFSRKIPKIEEIPLFLLMVKPLI